MPVVREQKGNTGILLREPVDKADEYVLVSRWSSKAGADAYENSGLSQSLVGTLAGFPAKEPIQRSYASEEGQQ